MARKGDPDRSEQPDVEIGASVKADSLRFRERPRTDVELHGEVVEPSRREEMETASGSERRNLPEEVEPGVTYRDVGVRWRAVARIKEDEEDDRPESESEERRRR
jgi:hypothetical protein